MKETLFYARQSEHYGEGSVKVNVNISHIEILS